MEDEIRVWRGLAMTGKNAKNSIAWPDGMEPKTLFCAKAAIRQRVKLRIMITTNDT